jgi:hypothetical protein
LVFKLSNRLVGSIDADKEHISIEFSNGADSIDDSFLEGGGKKRRHPKIYDNDEIVLSNMEYFVNQAVNH